MSQHMKGKALILDQNLSNWLDQFYFTDMRKEKERMALAKELRKILVSDLLFKVNPEDEK